MAIINNAHRGSQINLLCLIYRVLRRTKSSKTVDEITKLCRPDTLLRKEDQKKRFPGELQFWQEKAHQLWIVDEQNIIKLTHMTESATPSPLEIADVTREALFSETIDDVIGSDENAIESLLRTLACLMASGRFLPFADELINKQSLDTLLEDFLLPEHGLNDSEKPTLLEYGQFLGFLEPQSNGYIVDPTRAVFAILSDLFSNGNKMKVREFIELLGDYLPVLDSGNYQNQVMQVMGTRGWNSGQENNISRALSHTLERLRLEKLLRLETVSDDSQAMQIQLPRQNLSISTIEFLGDQGNA